MAQNATTASTALSACRRVGGSDLKDDKYNLERLGRKHRGRHSNINRKEERFFFAWVHFGRLGISNRRSKPRIFIYHFMSEIILSALKEGETPGYRASWSLFKNVTGTLLASDSYSVKS